MNKGNYRIDSFCGQYVVMYRGEPMLIVNGLTTAQSILKLLEYDEYGEVHPICYNEAFHHRCSKSTDDIVFCEKCIHRDKTKCTRASHHICVGSDDFCSFGKKRGKRYREK